MSAMLDKLFSQAEELVVEINRPLNSSVVSGYLDTDSKFVKQEGRDPRHLVELMIWESPDPDMWKTFLHNNPVIGSSVTLALGGLNVQPLIEGLCVNVGDGATYHIGSDSYPFTIVEIKHKKRVILRRDNYIRVDKNGWGGEQVYEYIEDRNGELFEVSLRKDGVWRRKGDVRGGGRYSLGNRRAYQDPNF